MTAVHVVVPEGIDDPMRPSGGNTYDRRICAGLSRIGWSVHEHAVPGDWPLPDAESQLSLAATIDGVPDDALVLVDGLIGSAAPDVLVRAARRLRPVVLVHMPLGASTSDGVAEGVRERECTALSAALAVITTSGWTRQRLIECYSLTPDRVHVAEPGVDAAEPAAGTAGGGQLICVAALAPHKGHDVLLEALAELVDHEWQCTLVGSPDRDPAYVAELRRRASLGGIGDRVPFVGALCGKDLDAAYAAADALVLASRAETYGMVVSEALARGLPVVATRVGGLPEALGSDSGGRAPGLLVTPGDATALARALRAWLVDPQLRERLRGSARERRLTLNDWSTTSARISGVLAELAA